MFCLDTNVVIRSINKRTPDTARRLDEELRLGPRLMIPAVVLFELRYGAAKSDHAAQTLEKLAFFFPARFELLPFDEDDAEAAGFIRAGLERAGTPIGNYDILIAAQARRRAAAPPCWSPPTGASLNGRRG